jgi:hypothetical protein
VRTHWALDAVYPAKRAAKEVAWIQRSEMNESVWAQWLASLLLR